MRFDLVDAVVERGDLSIVTIKHVTGAEEYLQDHFAGFPVLPGVMMLEAMVQAGRRLIDRDPSAMPMVLGSVRGLKYGRFVPPGCTLVVRAEIAGEGEGGAVEFKCTADVREADGTVGPQRAASGRIVLRPARVC